MVRKRKHRPHKEPRLPAEIIAEVASHIPAAWDILNTCLISKSISTLLLPVLYASLDLKTVTRCIECLNLLIAQPSRARYVRTLILRPRGYEAGDDPSIASYSDEKTVARALELVIPHLQALQRFEWRGYDMPDDRTWTALRNHCMKLRYIAAGMRRINDAQVETELFRFNGLLGFSLSSISPPDFPMFPLPPLLVDMLTINCPDLEELTLASPNFGATNRPLYDGMALTRGRWPNLRTLDLEQLHLFDPTSSSIGNAQRREQVAAFFSAHSHLRDVAVPQEYLPPTGLHLTSFRTSTVYDATSYSGKMYHSLQTLDLSGTPGEGRHIVHLPSIVKSLPDLVSLAFSLNLRYLTPEHHHEAPSGFFKTVCPNEWIRAVLRNAPQLLNLRLICSIHRAATDLSLSLFPDVLLGSTLKTFELWRTHGYLFARHDDCDITPTAARLAITYPSIESMAFRMVHDRGVWRLDDDIVETIRDSAYIVVHGADGEPMQLIVQDRVPDPARRPGNDRYILDLRPKVGVLSKWRRALSSRLGGSEEEEMR